MSALCFMTAELAGVLRHLRRVLGGVRIEVVAITVTIDLLLASYDEGDTYPIADGDVAVSGGISRVSRNGTSPTGEIP